MPVAETSWMLARRSIVGVDSPAMRQNGCRSHGIPLRTAAVGLEDGVRRLFLRKGGFDGSCGVSTWVDRDSETCKSSSSRRAGQTGGDGATEKIAGGIARGV